LRPPPGEGRGDDNDELEIVEKPVHQNREVTSIRVSRAKSTKRLYQLDCYNRPPARGSVSRYLFLVSCHLAPVTCHFSPTTSCPRAARWSCASTCRPGRSPCGSSP